MADAWDQFPDAPKPAAGGGAAADPWAHFPDAPKPTSPSLLMAPVGGAELLGKYVTGAVAAIPAAVAYGGAAAARAAGADVDPAKIQSQVQNYLTYQPRSESGKAGEATIASAVQPVTNAVARKYSQATEAAASRSPFAGELMKAAPGALQAASAIVPVAAGLRGTQAALAAAPATTEAPTLLQATRNAVRPVAAEAPATPAQPLAPTTSQLKARAGAAYQRAEDAGLVLKNDSVQGLKESLTKAIDDAGGADATLHPDTSAALKRITEKPITSLSDLDQARQIARDAAGSMKPADQRLAHLLIDRIDEYASNLSAQDVWAGDPAKALPALREGRDLWSRYRKSEVLDDAVRRAELDASQYSQSGMENALRKQFRQLARNDKEMRRFSPQEQEAIRRVAVGAPIENALRYLGKFAPHGVVTSAALGALGHASGGLSALATAGAAELARMGATRMTRANVARASELVRRGAPRGAIVIPGNAFATPAVGNALAPGIALTDAEIRAAVQPRAANALARANASYAAQLLEADRGY